VCVLVCGDIFLSMYWLSQQISTHEFKKITAQSVGKKLTNGNEL